MTVAGINKYVKPLLENGKFFYISTNCLKTIYKSTSEDIQLDDECEILSWTDIDTQMVYHLAYSDIIIIAEVTPDTLIAPTVY